MSFLKVKYGLPILFWIVFIFWMSTGVFSFNYTSSIIVPVIKFVAKEISDERASHIHWLIRKSGHVTEYFILGALVIRAFCAGTIKSLTVRQTLYSLLIVVLYASSDEFHQFFIATRTASTSDIGIDTVGGICAIGIVAVWRLACVSQGKK